MTRFFGSYRNESEVESKLIVQYLLPQLGYSPNDWYQEVTFGKIRLDFLVIAVQDSFFAQNTNAFKVVIEAKHPNQNLNNHVQRLKHYINILNIDYGLLTNGKELRLYSNREHQFQLLFKCFRQELNERIHELIKLIGKEVLVKQSNNQKSENTTLVEVEQELQRLEQLYNVNNLEVKQHRMKTIAIYHNKGGVGKTTTVVNLAAALRKQGKRILVVDLDSQANTTFATGLIKFDDEEFDDIKDKNIVHLLQSEDFDSIPEVARKSQYTTPEIDVIPSHIDLMHYENELNQLDLSKLVLMQKLKEVENKYDIVLIDTPPSLNLYARIALITADYLIIPSDLKPFANQGLVNVKDFVKKVNGFRKQIGKDPINILGVLACKISTNSKFVQSTLKKRIANIESKYKLNIMDTVIYEREDLAKCAEKIQNIEGIEIADPKSVLDFKQDSVSAQEFEVLAIEVSQKIGLS